MKYEVLTSSLFDKEFKKLCKKHKSAKHDVMSFVEQLKLNPKQGISIGNDCFKIRIAITSKGRGKSSGARLITRVRVVNQQSICSLFMINLIKSPSPIINFNLF